LIGQLRFTEIVLLFLGVLNIRKVLRAAAGNELFFAFLFIFSALSYIVFDLINQGITLSTLKKAGSYSVLSAVFLITNWLIGKNDQRLFAALAGFAVSFVIVTAFNITIPNNTFHSNPWLVGLGEGMTILPLALISRFPRFRLVFMGALWLVLLCHLQFGSRNLLLVTFNSIILICFARAAGSSSPVVFSWEKFRRISAVLGAGIIIISIGFFVLLSKDLIPEKTARKVTEQMQTEYGLIAAARPDVLASVIGITKFPLTGYGSGVVDDEIFENYTRFATGGKRSAYEENYSRKHEWLSSPSHSHLFGAWLDAGFLAAIVWIFVIIFCLRMLTIASFHQNPSSPLTIFLASSTIWDVVFSPGPNRVELTLALAALFLVGRSLHIAQERYERTFRHGSDAHPDKGTMS